MKPNCALAFSVAAVVSGLMLAGCTAGENQVPGVTTTEETAPTGHRVIRVAGSPPTTPVTRGALLGDKDGPNLLHNVRALLLDENGNVIIGSRGTNRVMVYDSSGKFVRDIGRAGEGPGEFAAPYSLTFHGDTLIVLDAENGRVGKFSLAGEWLGSIPTARAGGDIPLYGLGTAAFANLDFDRSGPKLRRVFVRHSTGGRVDTIPGTDLRAIPTRGTTSFSIDCVTEASVKIFSTKERASPFQHPAVDGSLIVVSPEEYRLVFLDARGDTARVVVRALEPQAVDGEEWQAELGRYNEFRKNVPAGARCTSNELPRLMHKPIVRSVFYDSDGNLWVDATTREGRFFEVFDENGRLLRRVASVPRLEAVQPYVRGNRMVVIETDSLDIQQVRVYEMPGRGERP